jgi:hypothetical protein
MTTRSHKRKPAPDAAVCETEPTGEPVQPIRIAAVQEKVGESRDNLRRRGDWFGHRTGVKK